MGSESAPVAEILRDPSQLADNPFCGFRSSGVSRCLINSVDHDCNSHTERAHLAAASGLTGATMLAGAFAQTKKLGDGLSSEGAGALFAGSNQTTTLDCAGGGAHIFGSSNTLTLTGGCAWLDMVGSNNT